MAEKKITKREIINRMLADENIKVVPEFVAYLENELALLNKKAEKKGKTEDELKEIVRLQSLVVEGLATIEKGTVTEIQKTNSELAMLSNQKVTSILKALKEEGKVIRATEGRKTVFTLA